MTAGEKLDKTVAHFGNLANDAFPVVEELQALGENVQLYIPTQSHVTALPQWELLKFQVEDIGEPYRPNWERLNQDFVKPDWLHFLDLRSNIMSKLNRIRKEMKKYDLIVAHVPFFIYSYLLRRDYIPFEAGAIRYFGEARISYKGIRYWLMKKSYQHAKMILMTNPDTLDLCDKYRLNWVFMPFAINMQRYRPMKVDPLNYENVIFCYSRQDWKEKGQDKMIKAFAAFLKEQADSLLVLVNWGVDQQKSKSLIADFGIEKHVHWVPLMSKPCLVEWINKSTVIADQFNLGSSGTAGFEAMACGKPLIIFLSKSHFSRVYDEFPPVLNAGTEKEILFSLSLCNDKKKRDDAGRRSRQWVAKHHDSAVVARKHMEIYVKMLGG
ncbi:MAG TPA: glycosyltransferase [Candidatus Bathyarchaeia archaeon]|nr:glycosyltransferase [Candidatus Bathyarchaeia archaeon]